MSSLNILLPHPHVRSQSCHLERGLGFCMFFVQAGQGARQHVEFRAQTCTYRRRFKFRIAQFFVLRSGGMQRLRSSC